MLVAIMGLRVKEIPKEMTTRKEARLWTNEFDAQIVNHYSSYLKFNLSVLVLIG